MDDERLIPARVLFNWDFRKHRVCVRSCEFLDSIEMTPVINVEEANKALYHYIPELEEAKVWMNEWMNGYGLVGGWVVDGWMDDGLVVDGWMDG